MENNGWDVYPEVTVYAYGKRVDILGIRDNNTIAVEMKTTLSFDLVAQAVYWKNFCNYVYIAIPEWSKNRYGGYKPKSDGRHYAEELLMKENIGMLEISRTNLTAGESIPSKRKEVIYPVKDWERVITEYHKDAIPGGSRAGGHITVYRVTILKIKEFLKTRPNGATIKEILENVETHYSKQSEKYSLQSALFNFERDWCGIEKRGNINYYFVIKGS